MSTYLGLRIPKDLYQDLKKAAAQKRISLSQEVKARLIEFERLSNESSLHQKIQETLASSFLKKDKVSPSLHALVVESILLLRELIIRRDSQILMKVDGELDLLFGTDRRKIYED